jgi:3-hydroxyacyl-[acyl-carrier-protein] dehydratase
VSALLRAVTASLESGPAEGGDGVLSARYRFLPAFPGFSGHFPGDPILPAFVQLLAAVSLARSAARLPFRLSSVESAKFLSPIRPGEAVSVEIRLGAEGSLVTCDASISADGRRAASLLLHLAAGEETP